MRLSLIGLLAVFLMHVSAQAHDPAEAYVYDQAQTIQTVTERPLTYYLDRPANTEVKVPLLVVVDGSGCVGQLRESSWDNFRPGPDYPVAYARLRVEKPGVESTAGHGSECSEEFSKNYTIDNRVFDHLRIFQHLRAYADWWNGEIILWGWSDGGDIAAQIVGYYPGLDRAVLGAMGGGFTMAEHFENFWACPEAKTDDREACLADLRSDFQQMEDNPTWQNTWSGKDNTWRVWPTRLRSRLSILLQDNRTPILIVHGEEDHDSTPVESARKLVADLTAADNPAFTYWEVAGMEHGWNNLPPEDSAALRLAMKNWMFGLPVTQAVALSNTPPTIAQTTP